MEKILWSLGRDKSKSVIREAMMTEIGLVQALKTDWVVRKKTIVTLSAK